MRKFEIISKSRFDIDFNGYETKEYNVKVLLKDNQDDNINEYLDYEFITYA